MIRLQNVSVNYPVFNTRGRSLKHQVFGIAGGFLSNNAGHVTVNALSDISLAIEDGDRVGLLGFNGAGKSTLLRIMAGIYEPTSGVIERFGRVAPLLDISTGMNLECSGYENIILKALSLGLTKHEAKVILDEVAAFTELNDYLHVPIRTYSSGMMMRLAFAVCTSINADIILMDEWIGVGDSHFVRKASDRLQVFLDRSRILVFASHNNDLIREVCNKAILLNKGSVVTFGPIDEVMDQYRIIGDSPFFVPDKYMEVNKDLHPFREKGQLSSWSHFISMGVFESRCLGNGVHLDQFCKDPVFQKAKKERNAVAAVQRIAQVLPYLTSFECPPGWEAPKGSLPKDFVPANPADLIGRTDN